MFFAKHFPTSSSRFVTVWLATLFMAGGVLFPLGSLLFLTWSRGDIDWIDRQYECKSRCLEARPASAGPRIIIFGGSASVFGLDAELMEEKLGIQTINFATHAGLGLDFQISRIKRFAKKGDTALLCLEFEAYGDDSVPGQYLREYAFSFEKSFVFSLKPRVMLSFLFLNSADDYAEAFTRWNERLSGFSEQNISSLREAYSLIKLSENGDFRGKAPQQTFDGGPPMAALSPYAKSSLKGAFQWCIKHGVHLIITWPNRVYFPPPVGQSQFPIYTDVTEFCKENGVAVVGSLEESVYPREMFIDTVYHINEIGQRIRTDKLARRLRSHLGLPPPHGPKTTCVMASRYSVTNAHGVFAKNEDVSYKYLTDTALSPDCITPADLHTLARSGARIVCLDDATEEAAKEAGMRVQEIRSREASLEDWIRSYDHHLFFLTFVGVTHSPVPPANLPVTFARFLSDEGYRAGVVGTGPWSKAHRTARSAEMAEWSKRRFDPIPIKTPFHFRVSAKSGPLEMFDIAKPPILVEGESIADCSPGLAVTVVEPYLGIVCARGTFQGGPLVEWKLRQITVQ